jgi:predicted ABC-type ATPase
MPASEKDRRDFIRNKAKNITELRQKLALLGRNGLIINGTGDDLEKIQRIKTGLEKLGYETMMIMVNTNDEVSAARNVERGQRGGRTVPENIRREKWEAAQNARPELAKLFGDRYMEYDNSEDLRQAEPEVVKSKKEEMLQLYKNVQQFVTTPPGSDESQQWVADEMQKKDTLPVDKEGHELTPHPSSGAAEQAKRLGLQYYGFGRYGRNGTVTHRAVHDRLVEIRADASIKESIDEEFESLLDEDLRQWFDPKHPKGGWKRINSKGEAIGPCAREPGEPKPKCMSNEKRAKLSKQERASAVRAKRKHDPNPERKGGPINVSNFGKGKISESYQLSDSGSLNLLLLGTRIDEYDLEEQKKEIKLLKDKSGKVRTFMLRAAAAREAHTNGGTVMPYKNGYVIKLNEEIENVESNQRILRNWISEERRSKDGSQSGSFITEGITELIPGAEYAKGTGIEASPTGTQETGTRPKITLGQVRQRKKEQTQESIDKGIEPGLSMSSAGENASRKPLKTKQVEKPFEEAIGADGSIATSISDKKEDELKKVGINLQSFKAKRPI